MSKKETKLLTLICLIGLLTMIFVGCSNKPAETSGETINYPTREIEFIVPWAPGGGSDIEMRLAAEHAKKYLDTNFVIINLPGVGGTVGLEELKNRPANGYNIGMIHEGLLVSHHSKITDINYYDFEPIAVMSASDQYLAVANHLNVNTIKEFVEYGKENTVNFGGTIAGIPRVWVEQIGRTLGIKYNLVGYEGLSQSIQALAGGHIDAAIVDYASAIAFVEAGHFKLIGVGTEERVPEAPEVETFIENGYDIILMINRGIVAPKGTPQEIIDILAKAFEETSKDPEYIEAIRNVGATVNYMGPKDYKAYLERQDKIIKEIIEEISK